MISEYLISGTPFGSFPHNLRVEFCLIFSEKNGRE